MPSSEITRDGFSTAFGRFYAHGRVERIEAAKLRAMFLPRLTPEANKVLRNHSTFVRAQLQHYGVKFDESELTGQGTTLLKKALQAGKLDEVPDNIQALRHEMHRTWLDQMTPEDLASHPAYVMEKYFVDAAGAPDRTRTKAVVAIPYRLHSSHDPGQLREAADAVRGLHHATATTTGSGTGTGAEIVFLGWTKTAVSKAVKAHAAQEAKQAKPARQAKAKPAKQAKAKAKAEAAEAAAEYEDDSEGGELPPSFLNGQYAVTCGEVEEEWPDMAENMTLSIGGTSRHNLLRAAFDFGVVQGVMMLSFDEGLLDTLCKRDRDLSSDEGDYDDDDDGDDDDDDDDRDSGQHSATTGAKRKTTARSKGKRPPPAKKAKAVAGGGWKSSSRFFVRLKSMESETGEIHPTPTKGVIRVVDKGINQLAGTVNITGIGGDIKFTARRVRGPPRGLHDKWENYSQAAYEKARVDRWG
ncbi:hypothetical protein B0H67DRAFT_557148 [Lasiosphaeris hirsuta]|uniref:Uncharacterized protein n=1 Tax=Lasiosphaeris hirsuta TaxID=260670 RepID=A0AA39ZVI5_9PEZI|nr:hypothetical protein B0H67DRAFT_557148 [Lasiosphaeris hirsuta]